MSKELDVKSKIELHLKDDKTDWDAVAELVRDGKSEQEESQSVLAEIMALPSFDSTRDKVVYYRHDRKARVSFSASLVVINVNVDSGYLSYEFTYRNQDFDERFHRLCLELHELFK